MFSIAEFKSTCDVLCKNAIHAVTPLQVMTYLRKGNSNLNDMRIHILSNAFEKMPGYGNYLIDEFITLMRLKTIIE